ncbi:MAG TPA: hypothetical protein VFA86_12875 [Gammaproteobacteria bacterium]|nr:hypothetical protein [Gammaproteobacteria bacterium]
MEIRLMFAILVLAAFAAVFRSGGSPAPRPAATAAAASGARRLRRVQDPRRSAARVPVMLRRIDRQLAKPVPADISRQQMRQRMRTLHRQMQSLLHRMTVQRPVTRPPASAG